MSELLHARPPAFFLAELDGERGPRLAPEDARHALRVLRLVAGDALVGLDGRGGRLPLRVRAVHGRELDLEPAGALEQTPEPGAEGARLPWFEVAVAWPRRNRVEDMLGRLVQLGAAAVRPLAARRRGPEEVPEEPSERLRRVIREACKQSGRAWPLELAAPIAPAALAELHRGDVVGVLDPGASLSLDTWLRSLRPAPIGPGTRARPIVLAIGPEGGWADDEHTALLDAGASALWLAPHVLRVETAAEAAMAIAGVVHGRPPAPEGPPPSG